MTRSIFVTGGAAGIGLETAKLFRDKGWRVGVGDVVDGPDEIGVESFLLDVRERRSWQDALAGFCGEGGLDVLVNNAGVVRYGLLEDISGEDTDLIVDVNLKGVLNGARIALPYLKRGQRPVLVNVASAGALYGGPRLAAYTATKAGVKGLSEALDGEWVQHAIEVRCVMPWFTQTSMVDAPGKGRNASIKDDMGNLGVHGAEVPAQAIWNAVHSDKLHHPVGGKARMTWRLVRYFPNFMRKNVRRQRKPD
ncbi:SDR family NAD(P)-dependent oxidoreductase [Erythrobacter litoralis]|uniref:SDR family NAD(P)-dependent oxidoreductase n=1 Tax=Erythrobacter litoralis TaxID=39960 RepID=UPI002434AFAA|nr:SDR family NAD(P)-dependent oxidoreductase [Erythrobacter litoralis]MDG6079848.1 SDR family NAD(P)-dependent oxidoreductase [Erythrobacter litoralis]